MITQVCNISCEGCTNYSDLTHKGYVTWEEGLNSLSRWLDIIEIPDFGIMGGEPLVNPQVYDWIYGVRELMPTTQIRFTTNGLLLNKNKFRNIMQVMQDVGNIVFKITVHINNTTVQDFIDNTLSRYKWEEVIEFGIKRHKTTNNVRFQLNYPSEFIKPFDGSYANMKPYFSNAEMAFNQCIQQTCPLLYKDRIYKCSTSALLEDTLTRFGNPNDELWEKFITRGISFTDNKEIISNFLDNFGKSNHICSQCPSLHNMDIFIQHNESTISNIDKY